MANKPLTCRGCGLVFATGTSLDAHRIGIYPNWRCLTPEEMQHCGMGKNKKGLWVVGRNNFTVRR